MPTFIKKPVKVQAFRLGLPGQPSPVPYWFGSPGPSSILEDGLLITTPHGFAKARWGDWIILGTDGHFSVDYHDHFILEYDLVSGD